MKRILLTTLIILSTTLCIAQQAFVKKYHSMITIADGIKGEWESTDLTVSFNSKETKESKNIIFYYPNGTSRTFYQITNMVKGTTGNGDTYQIIQCLDEAGQRVALQLFDDDTCLRVLVDIGYYIEFHRD